MNRRLIPLALLVCSLHAQNAPDEQTPDITKLSEALGHLIGKNLQSSGIPIDLDAVARGMKDASSGKSAPLTEGECDEALSALQIKRQAAQSEANFAEAIGFLAKNKTAQGIASIEEGKIQYRIDRPGDGESVDLYNTPLLRYKGRYLNGTVFGASDGTEAVPLDSALPGFAKGIAGMKEGETRTLYIHPDLGYGKNTPSMPNALLIFEVELIKAQMLKASEDPIPLKPFTAP